MKINKKITKYNRYIYDSPREIEYIVIHWVGAASSARNNATYFAGAYRGASAHYFVDDKEIWQSVLDENGAFAVGGGLLDRGSPYRKNGAKYYEKCLNKNSISIEMCCTRIKGELAVSDKTIERTAELVQFLQNKYNVPDSRVIRHFDVNGKICPGPYIEELKWEKLHAKLTGNYFKVRTKGKLIAREGASLTSEQTRTLVKGKVYGIIKTGANGTRGKTVRGDWITITEKYAERL